MKNRNSTLWELSFAGSKAFLLGTMHTSALYASKRMNEIHQCIARAAIVYIESDTASLQKSVLFLSEKRSIKDFFTPRQYKKYEKVLEKHWQLDFNALSNLYPLIVQNVITQKILQAENQIPLDMLIANRARDMGKNVESIESAETQLQIFQEIELGDQIKMLKSTLSNARTFTMKTLRMVDMYQEERIHQLYQLTRSSLGPYKRLLLFDRNRHMKHRILESMADDNFYTLGAAHLSGEKGILHLLRQAGVKIRPILSGVSEPL